MLEKDCLLIKELEIIVVLLPFFTVYHIIMMMNILLIMLLYCNDIEEYLKYDSSGTKREN